jgi:hypothetical protein
MNREIEHKNDRVIAQTYVEPKHDPYPVVVSTIRIADELRSIDRLMNVVAASADIEFEWDTDKDYETQVFQATSDTDFNTHVGLYYQAYATKEEAAHGHQWIVEALEGGTLELRPLV